MNKRNPVRDKAEPARDSVDPRDKLRCLASALEDWESKLEHLSVLYLRIVVDQLTSSHIL